MKYIPPMLTDSIWLPKGTNQTKKLVNIDGLLKSQKRLLHGTKKQEVITFPPSVSGLFTIPTILEIETQSYHSYPQKEPKRHAYYFATGQLPPVSHSF
jgi:hypothetical protein